LVRGKDPATVRALDGTKKNRYPPAIGIYPAWDLL